MSEFVVHFTEKCADWQSILYQGLIQPSGPFGFLSTHSARPDSQMSCCLSEIPLDMLDRLAGRHGEYGIVLRKDFVQASGGNRVWYLDKGSSPADVLFDQLRRHFPNLDENDPLLRVAPFVDYVTDSRSFEWEREWRVVGGLRFQPGDVQYLFVPEREHDSARSFVDDHAEAGSGPDLRHAPMLDARWDDVKLQGNL